MGITAFAGSEKVPWCISGAGELFFSVRGRTAVPASILGSGLMRKINQLQVLSAICLTQDRAAMLSGAGILQHAKYLEEGD